MNDVYESPELFDLGSAEELTLANMGATVDCDCRGKASLMDVAF